MPKDASSLSFEWESLWSYWKRHPKSLQKDLWLGYKYPNGRRADGLYVILKDIVETETSSVIEEVFENAPQNVLEFFGLAYRSSKDDAEWEEARKRLDKEYA